MWKLYGLKPDGVAIQSTVGIVAGLLTTHSFDRVRYYDPNVPFDEPMFGEELIRLKRQDFEWEEEIRFWEIDFDILRRIENGEKIDETDVDGGKEIQISDLAQFIQRIVIAPGASAAFVRTVRDLCKATKKNWLAERVERSASDRKRDSYFT